MESKHAPAAASQLDAADEDGWPITDIIEELDDDDNVISYRLVTADDSMDHVQKALEKAGITNSSDPKPPVKEEAPQDAPPSSEKAAQDIEMPDAPSSTPAKKTVSFSEDTTSKEEVRPEMPFRARRVEQIMNTAKEQESISKEIPIIPEDEDPEAAALRQEMLKYGMGEIGAVVAELQLEEGGSDDSEFDDDEDEGFAEDSDGDDLEDEYGRNGCVVTDQYRQRMLELEKKLGITSLSSQVPSAGDDEASSDDEGIGRIRVSREEASSSSSTATPLKPSIKETLKSETEGKKNVRFASSLDIAPEKEPTGPAPSAIQETKEVDPLSDIVERSAPSNPKTRQPTKKASRFKKSRDDVSTTVVVPKGPMDMAAHFTNQDRPSAPSGPDGATIADTLVERETTSNVVPPDEFDGSIAYQEVADEYQKMRRKFIQREGGFLKEDESPVQPIVDEENQEPMSRFKAARLSRQ